MQPILYSYRRIKLLYNCITVKMSLQWQNAFFQLYTIIFIVSTFVFSHKNLSCKIFRKMQLKAFLKLSSHKIRSVRKSFKPEFTKRKLKHNARLLANTWLDKDKINEDEDKYQPNSIPISDKTLSETEHLIHPSSLLNIYVQPHCTTVD